MKQASPTTKILTPSKVRKQNGNGHAPPPEEEASDIARRTESVKTQMATETSGILPFPEQIFPEAYQRLMKVFYTSSGLPFEYYYASLLAVHSILMGNKFRIRAKSDFVQCQILYLAIVGKSGLGKSPPMKTIFGPLYDIEARNNEENDKLYNAWFAQKMDAQESKTEFQKEEPQPTQLLVGETTIEALFEMLSQNPIGMGMVDEELTGWLSKMGMYTNGKGNELQWWLKLFDVIGYDSIKRKGNKNKIVIRKGNVTIFGGVQPGLLTAIANGKMSAIGLPQRFQFVVPESTDVPDWNEIEPDPSVFAKYRSLIDFVHTLPSKINRVDMVDNYNHWSIEHIDMPLGKRAKELYVAFYRTLRDRMNEEEDEKKFGQLSKLRSYCLRYALILEIMHFGADNFENQDWWKLSINDQLDQLCKHEISERAMSGAIALIEYFISTSMNVLARFDSVLNTYPKSVRIWYKNLPDQFVGRFAVEIGESAGLSRSTVYNHLNDAVLFKKLENGMVTKRIVTE